MTVHASLSHDPTPNLHRFLTCRQRAVAPRRFQPWLSVLAERYSDVLCVGDYRLLFPPCSLRMPERGELCGCAAYYRMIDGAYVP
jgi:hypothetical protein